MNGPANIRQELKYVQNAKALIGTEKDLLSKNLKKSQGRLIDETGNRYGKLLVMGYAGSGKEFKSGFDGGSAWFCECDCGKFTIALGTKLRRGLHKSCGCGRKLPEGEASLNAKISVMKFSAKRRGYAWNLTRNQVRKLLKGNCAYCGSPPVVKSQGRTCKGPFICNGIDRIDNKKGYKIGNVVSCCPTCNKAKSTKSVPEFLLWIKAIIIHNEWNCCDVRGMGFKGIG